MWESVTFNILGGVIASAIVLAVTFVLRTRHRRALCRVLPGHYTVCRKYNNHLEGTIKIEVSGPTVTVTSSEWKLGGDWHTEFILNDASPFSARAAYRHDRNDEVMWGFFDIQFNKKKMTQILVHRSYASKEDKLVVHGLIWEKLTEQRSAVVANPQADIDVAVKQDVKSDNKSESGCVA